MPTDYLMGLDCSSNIPCLSSGGTPCPSPKPETYWNTWYDKNGNSTLSGNPVTYRVAAGSPVRPGSYPNAVFPVWVNPQTNPLAGQTLIINRTVKIDKGGRYYFYFSADNDLTVYVNGDNIGSVINPTIGWTQQQVVMKELVQGYAILRFEAFNRPNGTSTWDDNPAGISVYIVQGKLNEELIRWRVIEGAGTRYQSGVGLRTLPTSFTPPSYPYTGYIKLQTQDPITMVWTTISQGTSLNGSTVYFSY